MTKRLALAVLLCLALIGTAVGQYPTKIIPVKEPGKEIGVDELYRMVVSQKVIDELRRKLDDQFKRIISGRIECRIDSSGDRDTFIAVDIRTTNYSVILQSIGVDGLLFYDSSFTDSGFWMEVGATLSQARIDYHIIKDR